MSSSSESNLTVEKSAKDVINQLAAIIRTAQIHDISNVAVQNAIDRLIGTLRAAFAGSQGTDALMLELVGDYFFVNESRVKFSMEHLVNFDYLVREFKKIKLGSITLNSGIEVGELKALVAALLSCHFSASPFDDLAQKVEPLASVSVAAPRIEKSVEVTRNQDDFRKVVKNTYFNAVSFTKGVMNKIRTGERINVRRAKRVVQSMVDILLTQEELMMGMTAIKDYDDYTYHHCVNVSIISIALGQRLGFPKQALLELGMVALFHDIGKMQVPAEVLNKPSSFTEEEWKIVKRHPLWGVRAILKMKGFDHLSIRAAIVAFEHHIRMDSSGYPMRRNPSDLDLFSRIVSIADQYDGMTSARVYSRSPMTPEKALSLMLERAGAQLDPLLFKFFVNLVGVYPVGTAVMLSSNEMALVYGNNAISADRPRVMIISDAMGQKTRGRLVDLSEKAQDGKYKLTITKTLDPAKYKINLAEYML